MNGALTRFKEEAKRLLDGSEVRYILGYQRSFDGVGARPAVFFPGDDLDRMVLDARSAAGLVSYLFLDGRENPGQEQAVGVVVKGCDVRALERLVVDHRIDRDRVKLLGVPCPGVIDLEKLAGVGLADVRSVETTDDAFVVVTGDDKIHRLDRAQYGAGKCTTCAEHNPRGVDIMLAEELQIPASGPDYTPVADVDNMDDDQRYAFWEEQLGKCIRCYACRNVCPACTCRSCVFDQAEPDWLSESMNMSEQVMFHFTRAWHVAGRCVDCNECERVCPVGIPLMLLNHKLMKDVGELFDVDRPFVPQEQEPLGQYADNDPDFE